MRKTKTQLMYEALPNEVRYDIEMKLYLEYNDLYIRMKKLVERGDALPSDLTSLKKSEGQMRRKMVERWYAEHESTGNDI